MLRIALSTLGARKAGALGALAAVGLAVVLVVSCGILLESSLRKPIPVERLSAAAVVVQGDPQVKQENGEADITVLLTERRRIDTGLAGRIRDLPGVATVVADRSVYAQLLDRGGTVLEDRDGVTSVGHGWSSAALTPYTLASGHAPRLPADVVVDARLAAAGSIHPGDRARVLTTGSTRMFTVAGIAAPSRSLDLDEAGLFFRDDVAAGLAGTGSKVDLLGIVTSPGADAHAVASEVRDALDRPELRVLTGGKRGEAESPDSALSREDTIAGLTVFAVLAAFIAVFVVASTFAFSVQQRHRELALFRAIGSTPRQVRRMVAGEAFLISLAAFVVAAPLGVAAAHAEQSLFTKAAILPEGLNVVTSWLPFVAGLVAALVTTQLAVFASARRASRIRPTEALREATAPRRALSWVRVLAGLAMLAAGVAVVAVLAHGSASDAPAGTMVLMLAGVLLGPVLALPFVQVLGLPASAISKGPGMLARANARSNLRRAASVATPLMLAISLICTILFAKSALHAQTDSQTDQRLVANYVLRPHDAPGLPASVATAARGIPGVSHASGSIATSVVVLADGTHPRVFPARGIDPATLGGVIDLDVASGSLGALRGDTLAVGTSSAKDFGWHLGERVALRLGDGTPVRLRVVATYKRPLGFAEVVLPRSLAERYVTDVLDDAVFVRAAGAGGLDAFARAHPTVDVLTRAEYRHELQVDAAAQSLGVYVLLAVIGLFCAMALVNAITMATAERAREFALLRLVGASKRQVRAMVRAETMIVVAFGLTIGSIVAAPGLAAFSYSLTGSAMPSIPLKAYGALLGAFALLGFAATVLPTRVALRMDPVKAMAARE
jgi:putative ABC transport system permease protein